MSHNDKRSVHTDALETLGTIIGEGEARDAIHLAVEPIEAGSMMAPGQHVNIVNGTAFPCDINGGLGIVDPFLDSMVKKGDRFWLVVYPRKITSLRHVWTHPDFEPVADIPSVPAKHDSEVWMRAWAVKHMGEDYYGDYGAKRSEEEAYQSAILAGHENSVGPYECAREHIDNEWWDHWEAITGQRGSRGEYFSCAC